MPERLCYIEGKVYPNSAGSLDAQEVEDIAGVSLYMTKKGRILWQVIFTLKEYDMIYLLVIRGLLYVSHCAKFWGKQDSQSPSP